MCERSMTASSRKSKHRLCDSSPRESCALFTVNRDLPLGAHAGGRGLLSAVPRLPLARGRRRRGALLPRLQGEDTGGGGAGQVGVGPQASFGGREAALHGGALVGTALLAKEPAEQSQELLPDAAVHVSVNVRVEAALQEEEHKGKGGQPRRHLCSGAHGDSVQYAVRPHAENI